MTDKQISYEEFYQLWTSLKGNLRVVMNEIGISPWDTKEERERKIFEAFNPEMPFHITMHTTDGIVRYYYK